MVGQPADERFRFPPFRKEREMVGQPAGVFAAGFNTHPFAKSAKWWGSQRILEYIDGHSRQRSLRDAAGGPRGD